MEMIWRMFLATIGVAVIAQEELEGARKSPG